MINDIFYNRYKQRLFWGDGVNPKHQTFLTQVVVMIFDELVSKISLPIIVFENANRKLAKELGTVRINNAKRHDEACGTFLLESYDLWNDNHGTPDDYMKMRLSLIEIIYREIEDLISKENDPKLSGINSFLNIKENNSCEYRSEVNSSIEELNLRFINADMPLHYHNGYIQFSNNDVITQEVEKPLWEMLKDPKWKNVDLDLKESLHKRDNNQRDAALYACKSLESTIKIISDDLGLTSGHERGAANYIDNLVSKANGRIIDVWEAELLKQFFTKIRNPHGHGPGSESMPNLTKEQEVWAIENSMIWIKSLIKRNA